MLLWIKCVEFKLKLCETWSKKHQKLLDRLELCLRYLRTHYSGLYGYIMLRVSQLVRGAYRLFGSVENLLFFMCVLVEGLRDNLVREEFQRCFMNAFSCMFDLAK